MAGEESADGLSPTLQHCFLACRCVFVHSPGYGTVYKGSSFTASGKDEAKKTELITSEQKETENYEEIEKQRSRRDKTRGVLFVILVLLSMTLAASYLVTDIAHGLSGQDLLVWNDTVLLGSNSSAIWNRQVSFSLDNDSSFIEDDNVSILEVPCHQLQVEPVPLPLKTEYVSFNSCASSNGKFICVLEEFLYLVPSNLTNVSYMFQSDSTHSNTSYSIILFGSYENFHSYLNGGPNIRVAGELTYNTSNITFNLMGHNITNSSYYFITIETANSTDEGFNFTRRGQRSLYHVAKPTSICMIDSTDVCVYTGLHSEYDSCFLVQLVSGREEEDNGDRALVFINYEGDIVGTAIFISSLVVCLLVFLFAVVLMVSCLMLGHFGHKRLFTWPRKPGYIRIQD